MKGLRFRVIVLCCFPLVFTSCATFKGVWPDGDLAPETDFRPAWTPLFRGVEYAEASLRDPSLAVYCLRVNLADPDVEIFVTPPDGADGGYRLSRTTTAARQYGLSAAVNATPFSPVTLFEGEECSLAGLSISGSIVESPPRSPYGSIVFYADGRASILTYDETLHSLAAPSGITCAAGGFFVILRDGSVERDEFEGRTRSGRSSRSAVGLSTDGKTFYILVIDGKSTAHSVGATFCETASWLSAFGAEAGLMLDGGGSSALALADSAGRIRLVNVPVQGSLSGVERPVANHIGIRCLSR